MFQIQKTEDISLLTSCSFCGFPIKNHIINLLEDRPMNIPTKFGSKGPSVFGEDLNVKSYRDGHKVMTIASLFSSKLYLLNVISNCF